MVVWKKLQNNVTQLNNFTIKADTSGQSSIKEYQVIIIVQKYWKDSIKTTDFFNSNGNK